MNKILFGIYVACILTACASRPDTFESRRKLAKEILQKKFDLVVDVSTELAKKKNVILGIGVHYLVSSKCDCITDSLAIGMANKYSLNKLEELQSAPVESFKITLEEVIENNDGPVLNCFLNRW